MLYSGRNLIFQVSRIRVHYNPPGRRPLEELKSVDLIFQELEQLSRRTVTWPLVCPKLGSKWLMGLIKLRDWLARIHVISRIPRGSVAGSVPA
jgi:hypothetical protein